MSSGSLLAMVLEKPGAIKAWRNLMGPTNTFKAQDYAAELHPLDESKWPLRALFGTDGTRNATHGSDSPYSSLRERTFYFPEPKRWQRSVLFLLPSVAGDEAAVEKAVELLAHREFVVVARQKFRSTESAVAASVFAEHDDAARAAAMAGDGVCVALVLERASALTQLRLACGPPEGREAALDKAPDSLNALLTEGMDGGAVAALAAETGAAVQRAIDVVFGGELESELTLGVIKPGTADDPKAVQGIL